MPKADLAHPRFKTVAFIAQCKTIVLHCARSLLHRVMQKNHALIAAAERLFDTNGYTATGMDRLTQAAGMSSRTLYKHFGSKAAIMGLVLADRDRRFMESINLQSVDALFAAIEDWVRKEGARGCLFLRSLAETGGETSEIAAAVITHKAAFRKRISEIIAADLGHDDPVLAEQMLVLAEGAIHAAVYRGVAAVAAARSAAALLMDAAR
ncbi:TetR/AcrR family transcriptional regulator [Erythrobacter sp. LQ02-29]|uniref:TetR/AcrR family transcriptional regulator n=1 Tax=Erythrobacter sp. LQ02-29 TaxID=2920384 RepID=UPI001F4DC43C|nr:TetR/AcrR family transcriptional regulator [Erythrobacter sp. LQ02-29]MCP9223782.1 TetR/AcrR family transcriptional regulator [Erythrobacter sp. LQ02-29]